MMNANLKAANKKLKELTKQSIEMNKNGYTTSELNEWIKETMFFKSIRDRELKAVK